MKICHLTSVHVFNDTRIFVKECGSLSSTYETHLIAPGAPDKIVNGIHMHGVTNNEVKWKRILRTVNEVYQKALQLDADVYHFHDPELLTIGLKLRKQGKIVIYDVHEDVPKQILSKHWIPKPFRRMLGYSIGKMENFVSKRLSGIVTATPEINDRFITYNKNSITVQNFPYFEEWNDISNTTSEKENLVVYIGSITKPRGIIEIVNSMNKVNEKSNDEIRLLLGGKFSSQELIDEAKSLDGWKYVDFIGWVDREDISALMSKSKLGLVLIHPEPRYKVSYPVKMFEYMAAGIPVIASDFPLWKSIVEDNNCGKCVNPLSVNDIAGTILNLINNKVELEKMGSNGINAVRKKYSWESEKEKLLKLYQLLIKSRLYS